MMMSNRTVNPGVDRRCAVDPRIPVRMVVGARGAGKSAFIDALLSAGGRDGNAAAAILFMDRASFEAAASGERVSDELCVTRRGTALCFMGRDMLGALYQLHLRKLGLLPPTLDYGSVVVEVAPGAEVELLVSQLHGDMRLDLSFRFDGITCVLDLTSDPNRLDVETARHVSQADTVLLNKADLAGSTARADARRAIDRLNPFATVCTAVHGRPASALVPWKRAADAAGGDWARALGSETGAIPLPGDEAVPSDRGGDICLVGNYFTDTRSNQPDEAKPLRALRMRISGEVSMMPIMSLIQELHLRFGKDLHRLSGVFNVRNADYPVALEIVGQAVVPPAYGASERREDSEITLIGRGIDARETYDGFRRCVWSLEGPAGVGSYRF